jgi:hypothetical protein
MKQRKREIMIVRAIDDWFGDEKELNHATMTYADYQTIKSIVWKLMEWR